MSIIRQYLPIVRLKTLSVAPIGDSAHQYKTDKTHPDVWERTVGEGIEQ